MMISMWKSNHSFQIGKENEENEEIEEIEEIEEDSFPKTEKSGKREKPTALDAALTILEYGENSTRQLREKLLKKGYKQEEIQKVIPYLFQKRYVNDEDLMERYAAGLAKKKHFGRYRIKREMLRRFDREVVQLYYEESVRELDFAAYARAYVEKYRGKGRSYLIRRLQSLGYGVEEIRQAVKDLPHETVGGGQGER